MGQCCCGVVASWGVAVGVVVRGSSSAGIGVVVGVVVKSSCGDGGGGGCSCSGGCSGVFGGNSRRVVPRFGVYLLVLSTSKYGLNTRFILYILIGHLDNPPLSHSPLHYSKCLSSHRLFLYHPSLHFPLPFSFPLPNF